MSKSLRIIACAILSLSVLACGVVKGKAQAAKVAESLFQERISNGWTGSGKYYSDLFWKNTTKKKWSNIQKLVALAMGDLKSYSLASWNVQSKVNLNGLSGTVVILVYDTVYEKGKGKETLTVYKPLMGEKFAILGHNFNSDLLQKLIDKGIERAASGRSI